MPSSNAIAPPSSTARFQLSTVNSRLFCPNSFRITYICKNASTNPYGSHIYKTKDLKPFRITYLQEKGGGSPHAPTIVFPSEPAILAGDEGSQCSKGREPQSSNRQSLHLSSLTSTLTKNASVSPLTSTLTKTKDLKSFNINTYKKGVGVRAINARQEQCLRVIGTRRNNEGGMHSCASFPSSTSSASELRRKHDLPELLPPFQDFVRAAALRQRQDAVNHRTKPPLAHQLHDGEQFVFAPHVRAKNRKLPAKKEAQVNLRVIPGRRAAGNQPPAGSEARHAVVPGGCADVLEHHVHAALARQPLHLFVNLLLAVVDGFVGAQFARLGKFFFAARRRDHPRAQELRDLDRRASHAASRAENQDLFPGLQFRAVHQHVPGRLEDQRDRRGFDKREFARPGKTIRFRAAHVFGAAAVNDVSKICELPAFVVVAGKARCAAPATDSRREDNFLPDLDAAHQFADLRHLAGDVAPRDVRKRDGHAGNPLANPQVEMVDRHRAHPHQDIGGRDCGIRDL